MKAPRIGRPPIAKKDRKATLLSVRLTEIERRIVERAAKTAGVTVYRKETSGDYFDRSDNYSFALAGVVAHTIVVGFEFADYHEVSDEAWKLDYRNLARVDRGIAAGVAAVANAAEAPKWSDGARERSFR